MAILFSVTGSIQPSSFAFFETTEKNLKELQEQKKYSSDKLTPVLVDEKGYLGTISNSFKSQQEYQKAVDSGKKSPLNGNPGRQDTAFLSPDKDILVLRGSVKFINNYHFPSLADNKEQKDLYKKFIEKYKAEFSLKELVTRYVKNLVSGKILWRNKYGFDKTLFIDVKSQKNNQQFIFNCDDIEYDFDKNLFNTDEGNNNLNALVSLIVDAIDKKDGFVILNVNYFINVGFGANLYPSQSFVEDKDENKGKYLAYQQIPQGKQAILHSQKVGNALRTIDTWYQEEADAIPVEVYGVLVTQREARRPSGKNSFFDYFEPKKFEAFVSNYEKQKTEDKHYIMSMFIKGGVFGVN